MNPNSSQQANIVQKLKRESPSILRLNLLSKERMIE